MPAITPADVENMINGADVRSTVTINGSTVINGVLTRAFSESFDINGRSARVNISNTDAGLVAVGNTAVVNSINYIVRAMEAGDEITGLVLEVQ